MIRPIFLAVATALALPVLTPMTAEAGPIRNACLRTDKGNRSVCSCIQQVADMTLRGADQRRAPTSSQSVPALSDMSDAFSPVMHRRR